MLKIDESGSTRVITDSDTGRGYREHRCTVCHEWFIDDGIIWIEHNPYCEDHIPKEGEVD